MPKYGLPLIRVLTHNEKSVSVFSRILTESAILSICGKMRIRESSYFGIFCALYNMISMKYRHVYQMIILTMVRSMSKHMLNNLMVVARYRNFLLLSTNWPILNIWLSHVPRYAYFFHRVLEKKILILSVQMDGPRIYFQM